MLQDKRAVGVSIVPGLTARRAPGPVARTHVVGERERVSSSRILPVPSGDGRRVCRIDSAGEI